MKHFYKKVSLCLMAIMTAANIFAETVEIDGITYDTDADNKCAIVSKVPDTQVGVVVILEIITYDNTEYKVKEIGPEAFYRCEQITSVNLPNIITTIGDKAFWGCSRIKSFNFPESLTTIGKEAFYACPFKTIYIPESVTSIEDGVFKCCFHLTSVVLPNTITKIGENAFSIL